MHRYPDKADASLVALSVALPQPGMRYIGCFITDLWRTCDNIIKRMRRDGRKVTFSCSIHGKVPDHRCSALLRIVAILVKDALEAIRAFGRPASISVAIDVREESIEVVVLYNDLFARRSPQHKINRSWLSELVRSFNGDIHSSTYLRSAKTSVKILIS